MNEIKIQSQLFFTINISSVQFSSFAQLYLTLQTHGLQHNRPLCPLQTLRVYSNSCPLSRWCHTTISSSAIPFSSCLQSFSASGSSQISHFFASGRQSISFSFNISHSNEYSGLISFRIEWFDLLSVQGTLKSLLRHHSSEASVLWCSAFFIVFLSHPYTSTGKTIVLTRRTLSACPCFLICCLGLSWLFFQGASVF